MCTPVPPPAKSITLYVTWHLIRSCSFLEVLCYPLSSVITPSCFFVDEFWIYVLAYTAYVYHLSRSYVWWVVKLYKWVQNRVWYSSHQILNRLHQPLSVAVVWSILNLIRWVTTTCELRVLVGGDYVVNMFFALLISLIALFRIALFSVFACFLSTLVSLHELRITSIHWTLSELFSQFFSAWMDAIIRLLHEHTSIIFNEGTQRDN